MPSSHRRYKDWTIDRIRADAPDREARDSGPLLCVKYLTFNKCLFRS
jgi:hypothetical protein